jgi:Ni/Fe-hydrogenase subunit HybB-like protein
VDPKRLPHGIGYPRFLWRIVVMATDGSAKFYVWMTVLTAIALVGFNAWAEQVATGMAVTDMSDHVSWGLYIANFTFAVGVAAGGVMMVIPAYLYDDHDMHDVSLIGELLAVAAIIMALIFVTVDLGRPDRFWHLIPGIGRFNWPMSMLTWDVVVLSGYLLLNLHICGYQLYSRFRGEEPRHKWYVPFVMVSIIWAVSIHTVTAFLYQGLGGRPFWNSALLAPRFLTSAFVAGPAFLIVTLTVMRRFAGFTLGASAVQTLIRIVRVTAVINLFMLFSEVFTEFYTGGSHTAAARYLFFGLHGHYELVPWMWSAIGLNVVACGLLLWPGLSKRPTLLVTACVMTIIGCWIEKGMGLIIPAFIPSTLGEIVPYVPTATEWKITAGTWAAGLGIFTVAIKVALPFMGAHSKPPLSLSGDRGHHGEPISTERRC